MGGYLTMTNLFYFAYEASVPGAHTTVSSGSLESEQEGGFQACTLIFVWVGTCGEVGEVG